MISKNQIKYVRQLEQKKFRKAENLFIAEGHKVVGDLLAAGFIPTQLFATADWLESNILPPRSALPLGSSKKVGGTQRGLSEGLSEPIFVLKGKGWGHGVGLCQIGAAVMGEQGHPYDEILLFYYRNAEIKRLYD